MASVDIRKVLWYRRFRGAAYASVIAALLWTLLIVLPFVPFSYLQPVIVGGGAGVWFVIAYVLFIAVGVCGFGWLSSSLYVVEVYENRSVGGWLMNIGFASLELGISTTCLLLALGGAMGGYASTLNGASAQVVHGLLVPFVLPTSIATLVALTGAAEVVLAMVRARRS